MVPEANFKKHPCFYPFSSSLGDNIMASRKGKGENVGTLWQNDFQIRQISLPTEQCQRCMPSGAA